MLAVAVLIRRFDIQLKDKVVDLESDLKEPTVGVSHPARDCTADPK